MAAPRPKTIAEYIAAAPREGQAPLRRLRAILREEAPDAQEAIKWGTPFFIEPRFLFGFSAYKVHLNFAPTRGAMKAFTKELAGHQTTANFLQVPYDAPLPEALIRKMAKHCVRELRERKSEGFWS